MEHDVRVFLRAEQAIAGVFAAGLIFFSSPTAASSVEQGRRLALLYCAKCHSTDKVSPSPLKIVPPFRTLHARYPVEMLQEALAEGIVLLEWPERLGKLLPQHLSVTLELDGDGRRALLDV